MRATPELLQRPLREGGFLSGCDWGTDAANCALSQRTKYGLRRNRGPNFSICCSNFPLQVDHPLQIMLLAPGLVHTVLALHDGMLDCLKEQQLQLLRCLSAS